MRPVFSSAVRVARRGLATLVLALPSVALAQRGPFGGDEQVNVPRAGLREATVRVLNFALTFVGLIAVAMLIYGGFRYLTSAGNEETTKQAKRIILYAIIGIVVILLSAVIVNFLVGSVPQAIQGTQQ